MGISTRNVLIAFSLFCTLFLSGCGSTTDFDSYLIDKYKQSNRIQRYYELREKYDNIRVIMLLNSKEDAAWITNFLLWCFFSILPDLPTALAGGGTIAVFYLIAWFIGVALTGGGILAVLAWLGGMAGGIPGIPPALTGIIYLGLIFKVLHELFSLI